MKPNGALATLHSNQALGTLEFHAKKLDVYGNFGAEFVGRAWYTNDKGKPEGYGSSLFSNAGCGTEIVPVPANGFSPELLANCTGDTRNLMETSVGLLVQALQRREGPVPVRSAILIRGQEYVVWRRRLTQCSRQHDLHLFPVLPAVTLLGWPVLGWPPAFFLPPDRGSRLNRRRMCNRLRTRNRNYVFLRKLTSEPCSSGHRVARPGNMIGRVGRLALLHHWRNCGKLVGRSRGLVGNRRNLARCIRVFVVAPFYHRESWKTSSCKTAPSAAASALRLVFSFALHAKTGVYGDGIPVKVTPSTAGKLWLNGQKMEIQPVTSSPSVLLFCIALFLIYRLYLHRKPRVPTAHCLPAARHLSLWHSHRFLRPPPVRA